MEFKCYECNRNFNSQEGLNQHNNAKHPENRKKGKTSLRKYLIIGIILLIIVFLTLTINSYSKKPGQHDDFAQCLTDKNVIVYGNDFCSYTNQQLNFFGKSKKYLNYIKCIDDQKLCDEKNIEITPTWEINNELYAGVQGLDKIAVISGCEI